MNIDITKLHDFENHPYKVLDNEEMEQLTESIMQYGVIAPIVVRPKENTADIRNRLDEQFVNINRWKINN